MEELSLAIQPNECFGLLVRAAGVAADWRCRCRLPSDGACPCLLSLASQSTPECFGLLAQLGG